MKRISLPENICLELTPQEINALGYYFRLHFDEIQSEAKNFARMALNGERVNERESSSYEIWKTNLMIEFYNLWIYHDTENPFHK